METSVRSSFLCSILLSAACISAALRISPARELSIDNLGDIAIIEEHLRSVSTPAVKSIQSPDGDIIDCILASEQLAFHHPLLKDHKLQESPTTVPDHLSAASRRQAYKLSQLWHQNGRCPKGTIPVRRITAADIVRTGSSPQHYGRKLYVGHPQVVGGIDHEHAYGYVTGDAYYGTKATLSLWDPYVELATEFSLAQLWVLTQNPDGSLNSTLEAGWQVFPQLYGDNNTRLFVYWTGDNYQNTGCYDLACPGFVQTSTNLVLGGTILSPVSTINGSQIEITLLVFKDSGTGNWWLEFNGEYVGYWPQNLSSLTGSYANLLEWGGEVINRQRNGQHTATQMGSGNFAEAGYKEAAYIRNLQWVDVQNNLQNVSNLQTGAENATCYDVVASSDNNWGTYFFFGGPGRNSKCP